MTCSCKAMSEPTCTQTHTHTNTGKSRISILVIDSFEKKKAISSGKICMNRNTYTRGSYKWQTECGLSTSGHLTRNENTPVIIVTDIRALQTKTTESQSQTSCQNHNFKSFKELQGEQVRPQKKSGMRMIIVNY